MSAKGILKNSTPEDLVKEHYRIHDEAVKRMKWKAGIRMEIVTLVTARVQGASAADVITAAKEIESYVMGDT